MAARRWTGRRLASSRIEGRLMTQTMEEVVVVEASIQWY